MGYGLISDTHQHNWSAFSHVDSDNVNSRNRIILDETLRAAKTAKAAGYSTIVHAGDLFHVRGSVAPSVLNPTLDTYRQIRDMGIQVRMIPGNHDMEAKDSGSMTNAIEALRGVGVDVIHGTNIIAEDNLVLIPWHSTINGLREAIEKAVDTILESGESHEYYDLIIHAPVDGVIMNIPDHGLSPVELATYGFNRVFSGHYHNHVDFGNGVYSIGATTHQTWNDVDSKAGFLLVGNDVEHHTSLAPSFVDLDPDLSDDEVPDYVNGNYIRAYIEIEKESEVKTLRAFLMKCGAAGVVINAVKKTATTSRTGSTANSGKSIQSSIADFITDKKYKRQKDLNLLCAEINAEAEEVA